MAMAVDNRCMAFFSLLISLKNVVGKLLGTATEVYIPVRSSRIYCFPTSFITGICGGTPESMSVKYERVYYGPAVVQQRDC